MSKPAVVLLSGGLDSATVLAIAQSQGYECHALSFDYGQRHGAELRAAERVAAAFGVRDCKRIHLGLDAIGGGVTKIIVAHRLATIRHADRIFFMQEGVVVGSGTFDDLVSAFPDFARQAALAGLA